MSAGEKQRINIGIIGFGTVGVGVLKIINDVRQHIRDKVGGDICVKKIVDKVLDRDFDVEFDKSILSGNIDDILNDPDIDIVVELIGGYEPAKSIIVKALEKKKHVVTANKAVLAKYWDEINSTAAKNNRLIYFEASVGAGIPVIQGLNEGLAGNHIESIYGILNGTANYILTKMLKEQYSFSDALTKAQELGFAEADPTFDIKGIDTAHKLAILASLAYEANISIDDVYCEGIDELELEDIEFANKEFDLVVKLLAIARKTGDKVELRVHPTFVPKDHMLAAVENEYNAVYINGDAAGNIMFYGKGAGQLPAASGVVSDIVYIAKHIVDGTAGKNQFVTYSANKNIDIYDINDIESKYYIRFHAVDKPNVFSKISSILGKHNISIAACFQKEKFDIKDYVPVVIATHVAKEKDIKDAIAEIDALDVIDKNRVYMRIEDRI